MLETVPTHVVDGNINKRVYDTLRLKHVKAWKLGLVYEKLAFNAREEIYLQTEQLEGASVVRWSLMKRILVKVKSILL